MKSWQVFFFTLVPLALVFIGVIGSSFGGADSELEVFPTQAPRPTPSGPPPTVEPGTTVLELVAETLEFDRRTLTVPAGGAVVLRLDNRDAGVLHNFAVYTDRNRSEDIFVGDLFEGPDVQDFDFTPPGAGTYFFRCDVHPDTMTGTFTVR